jgi:UDP-glucose 4-epimerase
MSVLITGAAGLLGTNFSQYLCEKGYDVVGIDDLSGGYEDYIDPRVKFYKTDLKDSSGVDEIFQNHDIDYVYHFAAYAAVGLSPFIRRFNYMNNVIASVNLINASINCGVKKFIFTSSMDVYGENQVPFTEDMVPAPEDPYGIAKYTIEQDLWAANDHFGLEYTIIRPHNVAGIYQNIWDKYRNVIGIWIRQALNGLPITIYGDGTQIRSFSDIRFYMQPFEKLMYNHSGEVFNIGADQYCSINELATMFQKVASANGCETERVYLESRKEVHTAYCDHKKAKEILGFNDDTNMEQLVESMFLWGKDQPNREVKLMPYEIEKNMYSYWKK